MSADRKPKWQAHRSVDLEIVDPGGPEPPPGDGKIGVNPLAGNHRVGEFPALPRVASLEQAGPVDGIGGGIGRSRSLFLLVSERDKVAMRDLWHLAYAIHPVVTNTSLLSPVRRTGTTWIRPPGVATR